MSMVYYFLGHSHIYLYSPVPRPFCPVADGERTTPPGQYSLSLLPYVGQLGSGPRLVGRIGSGVLVSSAGLQKIPPCSVLSAARRGITT